MSWKGGLIKKDGLYGVKFIGKDLKFEYWYGSVLCTRVFPETRVNCKEILMQMGFKNYDAESISRKTYIVLYNDLWWLRFDDEDLKSEDIKALGEKAGFPV